MSIVQVSLNDDTTGAVAAPCGQYSGVHRNYGMAVALTIVGALWIGQLPTAVCLLPAGAASAAAVFRLRPQCPTLMLLFATAWLVAAPGAFAVTAAVVAIYVFMLSFTVFLLCSKAVCVAVAVCGGVLICVSAEEAAKALTVAFVAPRSERRRHVGAVATAVGMATAQCLAGMLLLRRVVEHRDDGHGVSARPLPTPAAVALVGSVVLHALHVTASLLASRSPRYAARVVVLRTIVTLTVAAAVAASPSGAAMLQLVVRHFAIDIFAS
jgi:hypothetical protein